MFVDVLKTARPRQWVKNLFVFAAIIFSQKFFDPGALQSVGLSFVVFCLLSSSVYFLNDVADREADRQHPKKQHRPIAAGRMSIATALIISGVLMLGSLALSFALLDWKFTAIAVLYLINNIAYSSFFKHVVILDVIMVAMGFVFRSIAGAVVIPVYISPWFVITVFLLALFLAISKRRQELALHGEDKQSFRRVLDHYTIRMLDQMNIMAITSTLIIYTFYTFNAGQSQYLMLTIPFVIYGLLRYLYVMEYKGMGDNPTEVVLRDVPLQINLVLWMIASFVILYVIK